MKVKIRISTDRVLEFEADHRESIETIKNRIAELTGIPYKPIEVKKLSDEIVNNFDYVMVFPNKNVGSITSSVGDEVHLHYEQSKYAKDCCYAMLEAGLELYTYDSLQNDEFIVFIRANEKELIDFAVHIKHQMKLDPEIARRLMEAGSTERNEWGRQMIQGVVINENTEMFGEMYPAYDHIFVRFEKEHMERYDVKASIKDGMKPTPFSKLQRLRLLHYLLEAPQREGGCDIPLQDLLHHGKLLALFPLHQSERRQFLTKAAVQYLMFPWGLPIEEIKDYLGEKFALYFAFVGHYARTLIVPGIIGTAFALTTWSEYPVNYSNSVLPFCGITMTLWSVFMLETWKGIQARYALEWGMNAFEKGEPLRPQYKGELTTSYINGEEFEYYPPHKKEKRFRYSMVAIGSYVMVVVGVIASIYLIKASLQTKIGSQASMIASMMNAVTITTFNLMYSYITVALNDYENHRTDTEYEDAMVSKTFSFQFVNSYSSFFFISFIAQWLQAPPGAPPNFKGQCGAPTCMEALSTNLVIIFGARIFVTNVVNLLIPYVTYVAKLSSEIEGFDHDELTLAEKDYVLLPFNSLLDNTLNYSDLAITYGYMVLFVTAAPITPIASIMNLYIDCKVLLFKQVQYYQRPIPAGVQHIGAWHTILELMSHISVATNAGLLVYTMSTLDETGYDTMTKGWIFVGFQWVLSCLQHVLGAVVEEVPFDVEVQLKRTEFISSKLVDRIPDEEAHGPPPTVEAAAESSSRREFVEQESEKMDHKYHLRFGQYPDVFINERPGRQGVMRALLMQNINFEEYLDIHAAVDAGDELETTGGPEDETWL